METEHYLKVPVGYNLVHPDASTAGTDTAMDKYTASIELSNACRQFYKSRVEAAHCIKSRWARSQAPTTTTTTANDNDRPASAASTTTSTTDNRPRRQRNSIDEAMDKLRTEMTSLMEQDLSLMRQLLTLNETIEELKWQRRYRRSGPCSHYPPHHLHQHDDECGSSFDDLSHSDCSISDTEMYDSEDDLRAAITSPLGHSLHGSSTTTTSSSSSSSSTASNTTIITTVKTPTPASNCNDTITTSAGSPTCKSSTPMSLLVTSPSSSSSSSCSCQVTERTSPNASANTAATTTTTTNASSTSSAVNQKLPAAFAGKVYRSERNSFDSGIHDHSSEEEGAVA